MMKSPTKVGAVLLRAGLALALGGAAYADQAAAPGGKADARTGVGSYHRYYHKQRVDLQLDASRVAVRAADLKTLAPALAAVGLDAGRAEASVINGWWMVGLPRPAAPADLERLAAALAADPAVEFVSPIFLDDRGGPMWVTRDVAVGFLPGTTRAERAAAIAKVDPGAKVKRADWLPTVDAHEMSARNGFEVLAAANALAVRPEVRYAEPDWVATTYQTLIPNDPLFAQQWSMHSGSDQDMDAPEAWDITTGSNDIIVLILDNGVDRTHPDLNLGPTIDFTSFGGDGSHANECDGHGTGVAGAISARINNGIGVTGIAPTCRTASAKYSLASIPCTGSGTFQLGWLVDAINWSTTAGARVTNNSTQFPFFSIVEDAYVVTRNAGVLHFASTGNLGTSSISFPSTAAGVVAVGAVDSNGNRAGFSQYGDGIDLVAPGVSLPTTDRQGSAGNSPEDYVTVSGTSIASPYAAGVAALVFSRNPNLTPQQVEDILKNTAVDRGPAGYDTEYGYGFVNARAALDATPPVNDQCQHAINVSAGGTFHGTLVAATNSGAFPGHCGLGDVAPDIWYTFTAPADGTLTVSTCGTHDAPGLDTGPDTVLSLLSGCDGAVLSCNDDANAGGCGAADDSVRRDSQIIYQLTAGQTVLIRLARYGNNPTVGPVQLHVGFAVPNDQCANAIDVSAGGTFVGSLLPATNEGAISEHCGLAGNTRDVWYRFTAGSCGGDLVLSTCGTHDSPSHDAGTDTVLSIFGFCGGSVQACNDDSFNNFCGAADAPFVRDSHITMPLNAGQSVLIRVSHFGMGAPGPFMLHVSFNTGSNDDCAAASSIAALAPTPFCISDNSDGPTGATQCGVTFHNDLWWVYTPATNGAFTVRTCGSTVDTLLGIYAVCPGALTPSIACNDNSPMCSPGAASSVRAPGEAGLPMYIRVGTHAGGSGAGTLIVHCAADFNLSSVVSVQDIFDFLAAYFSNDPRADVNLVSGITVQDIFDFLAAYFGGC